MTIQLTNYQRAVQYLQREGSRTAAHVHIPHGGDGAVPDSYGRQLLIDARNDFDAQVNGRNIAGRAAVVQAAAMMGITDW